MKREGLCFLLKRIVDCAIEITASTAQQQQKRALALESKINKMQKYRLISKKGEGTFSEVLKAQSIKTGKYVAIKCMKNHFESIEQVNNLREI